MSLVVSDTKQCVAAGRESAVGTRCCSGCHNPDDERTPEWIREQDMPQFRSVRLFGGGTYLVCCETWGRIITSGRGEFA